MKRFLSIMLSCVAATASAQLFPADYLVDWQPGAVFLWPVAARTNHADLTVDIPGTNIVMSTGAADNVPALQAAIDLSVTNGVLNVPAGTYTFTNKVGVLTDTSFGKPYANHFTIRGATNAAGEPTTIFYADPNGTMSQLMTIGASYWAGGGGFQNGTDMRAITANVDVNDTSIEVASIPPNVIVGGPVWMDQDNEFPEITARGSGYVNNGSATSYDRPQNGTRNQMYCGVVTSIDGTTIHVRPPVSAQFTTARNASVGGQAVTRSGVTQYGHGVSIENILFTQNTNKTVARMVWIQATADSRIHNCIYSNVVAFLNLLNTPACFEITRCWLKDSPQAIVNTGYGIDSRGAGGLLVANNVFTGLYVPIVTANSAGGVVAYNTFRDNNYQGFGVSQGGTINVSHGSHAQSILIIGNDVEGRVHADFYHGSSRGMVLFRNHISGMKLAPDPTDENHSAVRFDGASLSNSVVGNILGLTNQSWFYTLTNSGFSRASNLIYQLGFPNIGNNAYTTPYEGVPASNYWQNVTATVWRHGNFLHSSDSVEWEPSSAERSIPNGIAPFTTAPSWWDTTKFPFPAIGSDLSPMVGYIPSRGRYEGVEYSPFLPPTTVLMAPQILFFY